MACWSQAARLTCSLWNNVAKSISTIWPWVFYGIAGTTIFSLFGSSTTLAGWEHFVPVYVFYVFHVFHVFLQISVKASKMQQGPGGFGIHAENKFLSCRTTNSSLNNAVGNGLTLTVIVFITANISGAHINPAVSSSFPHSLIWALYSRKLHVDGVVHHWRLILCVKSFAWCRNPFEADPLACLGLPDA